MRVGSLESYEKTEFNVRSPIELRLLLKEQQAPKVGNFKHKQLGSFIVCTTDCPGTIPRVFEFSNHDLELRRCLVQFYVQTFWVIPRERVTFMYRNTKLSLKQSHGGHVSYLEADGKN